MIPTALQFSNASCCVLAAVLALGAASASAGERAISIAASVAPAHALAAMVAGDRAEVTLLVPAGASPHDFALRPSTASAVSSADMVVMIGAGLDGFLDSALATLGDGAAVVKLSEAPGVALLEYRTGASWDDHHGDHRDHDDTHRDGHHHAHADGHDHAETDPHLWLNPANARAGVAALADRLSEIDPEGADLYAANAAEADAELAALAARMDARLAPMADRPFAVFHDAYQYLERRFGLTSVGAIAGVDAASPSPRRLAEIQRAIAESGAVCVFSEPQYDPRLVEVATEGTSAKGAVLDPLGAAIAPGPDHYILTMEALTDALVDCLG